MALASDLKARKLRELAREFGVEGRSQMNKEELIEALDYTAFDPASVAELEPKNTPFRWQYCKGGYDISGDFYAERDAEECRAWVGEDCVMEVVRTPRGLWRLESCDRWLRMSAYDKRFASPEDALEYVGRRHGLRYVESSEN